jgi:histidinol-phosphate aminotransferase
MPTYEDNIRKVTPYTPGEQPQRKVIKLNTNENPYPPSPKVLVAWEKFELDKLRLYPDPEATELVDAIARNYKVSNDKVFVGVGSDDVLALAFLTFFNSDKPILFPDITYSFYKVWAGLYDIPYVMPKLDENFKLKKEDYFVPNGGIIFPNPNAPTAVYESLEAVEEIISANPNSVVIIDEAYIDFVNVASSHCERREAIHTNHLGKLTNSHDEQGKTSHNSEVSAASLIDKYDNLLVVQTYSKSRSMAGIRIGFALGNPQLIKYLSDVKYSFNSYTMNYSTILLGTASIQDTAYFEKRVKDIIETREWAKKEFAKRGFEFTDSQANFLFVTHKTEDMNELFEALKEVGIYVRHWNGDRIANYLRVTIGTREEMQALFDFLDKKKENIW